MGEITGITWTDHTFNHVWGCKKVSPECKHCYAEQKCGDYWNGSYRTFSEKHWNEPIKWNKKSAAAGKRSRVFCASMADFADIDSPIEERKKLWDLIRKTPSLDWLLLTKRPEHIRTVLPDDWNDGYHNVALGVTVGTVKEGCPRLDILREIPSRMKFVSAEPLLEDISENINLEGIDWLIIGGESGVKARMMMPDWVLKLVVKGREAKCAIFFKQWGEFVPIVKTGFYEWVNISNNEVTKPSENAIKANESVYMERFGKFNIDDAIWGKTVHEIPEWRR